jgi:hypothetical protein
MLRDRAICCLCRLLSSIVVSLLFGRPFDGAAKSLLERFLATESLAWRLPTGTLFLTLCNFDEIEDLPVAEKQG